MASTADNPFLSQLGLTIDFFRSDGGKLAANMLETSLDYLINTGVSLEVRTDIARMINKWQELASPGNRLQGFQHCYVKLLATIEFILQQPLSSVADSFSPAFYLAQALARESAISPLSTFGGLALPSFTELFKKITSQTVEFREDPSTPHSRTHILTQLVNCFPSKGNIDQLDDTLTLLFQVLPHLGATPVLREAVVLKIKSILSSDTTPSPTNHHVPTTATSSSNISNSGYTGTQVLLDTHLHNVLHAVRSGHQQLAYFITSNKTLCSVRSATLETNLSAMIECLGIGALEGLIQDVADLEPRKLLPSLTVLVRELCSASTAVQCKLTILGVLLSVVQVLGAAPLLPHLGSVGSGCSDTPELYIPLFKLLTSVSIDSGSSDEVTTQALVVVSSIAKNSTTKTPAIQSALLECVNILKDQCKYSNIFHTDTLKVLEVYSVHNTAAYKNIVVWNSGKSAKKGNNGEFLMNAGVVSSSGGSGGGWWFSPKKNSASGSNSASNSVVNSPTKISVSINTDDVRGAEVVSSSLNTITMPNTQPNNTTYPTNATFSPPHPSNTTNTANNTQHTPTLYAPYTPIHTKANSVAPSPQSQNLALLQQQLYAQQQQLQHQMLIMQQLQIQEQLAHYEHSSGDNNSGGDGVSQGYYTAYPNAMNTTNTNTTSPYTNNTPYTNPYIIGVQSQTGVPLHYALHPPQSPTHTASTTYPAYPTNTTFAPYAVAPTQLFPAGTNGYSSTNGYSNGASEFTLGTSGGEVEVKRSGGMLSSAFGSLTAAKSPLA